MSPLTHDRQPSSINSDSQSYPCLRSCRVDLHYPKAANNMLLDSHRMWMEKITWMSLWTFVVDFAFARCEWSLNHVEEFIFYSSFLTQQKRTQSVPNRLSDTIYVDWRKIEQRNFWRKIEQRNFIRSLQINLKSTFLDHQWLNIPVRRPSKQ